jgi:choline kinase
MTKINHAVICAAGLGSRLGKNMPKTLVNITEDKKIIDFQLEMVEDIELVSYVIGYQYEKILEYVKDKRDDLRIIHNYGYEHNSTSYSIYLATKDIDEPYISIDGDLLINKKEFKNFYKKFKGKTILGITPSKTEDGVYVTLNGNREITSFQKKQKTPYEWANIACITKPIVLDKDEHFVYTQFEKHLPLQSYTIKHLYEVDTPRDLEFALQNLDKYKTD